MRKPISARKIKCKACNDWREDIYYTLQDGPFCTDCLKKRYPELFKRPALPRNADNRVSLKSKVASRMFAGK